MAKLVRYTGEDMELVYGRVYKVVLEKTRRNDTFYVLEGEEEKGPFPALFFKELYNDENVYMAFGRYIPIEGFCYRCKRLQVVDDGIELYSVRTSTVKAVEYLGNSIYRVLTCNSEYIVKVG